MIEQEIIDICTKYNIKKYTINQDGSIDVNENVYLSYLGLTELPLKFNKVSGYFNCNENQLTSLKGCPNYVGNSFDCSKNQLTSLEGSPEHVGGSFLCYENQLTSLVGSPEHVGGHFNCSNNQLTSLIGSPSYVGDYFNCYKNKLTSLEGYNPPYDKLYCDNKDKLIRKDKLKILETL